MCIEYVLWSMELMMFEHQKAWRTLTSDGEIFPDFESSSFPMKMQGISFLKRPEASLMVAFGSWLRSDVLESTLIP